MTMPLVTTTRGASLWLGKRPAGWPEYMERVVSSVISERYLEGGEVGEGYGGDGRVEGGEVRESSYARTIRNESFSTRARARSLLLPPAPSA